jgi:hypothetical protein
VHPAESGLCRRLYRHGCPGFTPDRRQRNDSEIDARRVRAGVPSLRTGVRAAREPTRALQSLCGCLSTLRAALQGSQWNCWCHSHRSRRAFIIDTASEIRCVEGEAHPHRSRLAQRMPGSLGPWSTPRRPNRLEACWRRLAQRQLVAEPLMRGDVHPLFAVTAGSVYEWIRRF